MLNFKIPDKLIYVSILVNKEMRKNVHVQITYLLTFFLKKKFQIFNMDA